VRYAEVQTLPTHGKYDRAKLRVSVRNQRRLGPTLETLAAPITATLISYRHSWHQMQGGGASVGSLTLPSTPILGVLRCQLLLSMLGHEKRIARSLRPRS
jgi:hypothetical protein